jgi:ERCC4-type nuclease
MQQEYSKAKSMGKQSNNFIYKFLQTSNKLTWNNLLQYGQKIHNHPSMQQQYSKAKSMGKQSNNFIYKFLQTLNKMTSNELLR